MRVLHIHSGNLYGGVETFLLALAKSRRLAPSMEMSAAVCFDDRIAAALRREGVPTSILGPVRLRRPDSVWRARQALSCLIAGDQFDVAVCHQAWPLAIFGSTVKAAGLPLVSWIHMAPSRHWIDRLAARIEPDLVVCNSRFTASLQTHTSARVAVAYYPIAAVMPVANTPERSQQIRQELNTPPDDVVVVQVSRMEALKGQMLCLEALAELRGSAGWTCWQIGGPQRAFEQRYFDSLRAAAERLGISTRVRFVGERADVPDLLAAGDIYCQPNLQPEGFGITFVEAMASGLPVVTTAIGGALEIVDDSCGVLLPQEDATAMRRSFATALTRLMSDRRERERLGIAGRTRARGLCDPTTQMRSIADLMEKVSAIPC
jgi:glycosyltransferase involved in cell wall biosynthesis